KSSKAVFGRDLRAACPPVKRGRPRDGTSRHYVYAGIRLRTDEEDEEDGEAEAAKEAEQEQLPLGEYDNALVPRTTRTKTAEQASGRPSGPSGPRDKDIVQPTNDSPSPARERETAAHRRSKSDDLPYTGSVVKVPEPPPDQLDDHGRPLGTNGSSEPG